jgi:septal ring factor EnvC (AmiA/AmiB activator)
MLTYQVAMNYEDDALTAERIRSLKAIAADPTVSDLLRESARRILAEPTKPRQAYADELRAAMDRLADELPPERTEDEIDATVREARAEVRRQRQLRRSEQAKRTGTV